MFAVNYYLITSVFMYPRRYAKDILRRLKLVFWEYLERCRYQGLGVFFEKFTYSHQTRILLRGVFCGFWIVSQNHDPSEPGLYALGHLVIVELYC